VAIPAPHNHHHHLTPAAVPLIIQ
jgi:chromate transport protein ChrA